ncbi:MAG: hypothetical protein IK130_08860 [Oscillospiraceae bacterium]|nr:hypothetical protein [Oscillospiraceae bacterium]
MKLSDIFHFTGKTAAFTALAALSCAIGCKFLSNPFPVSGAVSVLTGDVNVDSCITISDAILLARCCAEDLSCGITEAGLANSDLNNDGIVNIDDCTELLRLLVYGKFTADGKPIVNGTTAPAETTATAVQTTTAAPVTAATIITAPTATTTTTTVTTTTATTIPTATTAATTTTAKTTCKTMKVGSTVLPMDLPLSTFTDRTAPTELLTQKYQNGDITFAVYASDPARMIIVIADEAGIIGYYAVGTQFSVPDGFSVTDYVDSHPEGTGKTYAQLVLRKGSSINFSSVADKSDLSVLSKLNFYGVNALRGIHDMKPLNWSTAAEKSAREHSEEMAKLNYFDHASYDGTKFSVRMKNAGVNWRACSENIDVGYYSPFDALDGWYNSTKGHRENMLNAIYTHMGVGFAYGANTQYKYFGTQDFYLPK